MLCYLNKLIIPFSALIILANTGCSSSSKNKMKKIVDNQILLKPADSVIQKQTKGIDFIASGHLPVNWTLEIDFDKMVYFNAADGNSLQVLPSFGNKMQNTGYEKYVTATGRGPLEIIIYNDACDVKVKPGEIIRKTEINFDNKKYTGCGNYLFTNRLNDIWILEAINNDIQYPKNFQKGLPWIDLDLISNKMNGSDGCSKINSQFEVKGNRIRFTGFILTKNACKNASVEKIFSQFLSDKLVDYYLEKDKLVFYLEDDSKMVFTRKAF